MQRFMTVVPFMTMGLFTVVLSALFFVGWFDGTSIVFPSSSLRRRAEPSPSPVKAAVSSGSTSSAPKSTATPAKAPVQQPPPSSSLAMSPSTTVLKSSSTSPRTSSNDSPSPALIVSSRSPAPAAPTTSKPPAPADPPTSSKAPAPASPSPTSAKALSSSKSLIPSVSHISSSPHSSLSSTVTHTPAPALNSASHIPSEQSSPSILPSPIQSPANDSSSSGSSSILHDGQTTALVFTFVGIIAAFVVAGIIVLLWRRARALSRTSNEVSGPDMEEFRGIRRANSTSTGENRPASTSGFSEPEYNWQYQPPQRFATSPIHQQPLDLNSFAADPVSVHYTIYPDILPPPQAAARPVSPDSMYDDDSVYDGIQRRQQILQRLRDRRI